MSSSDTGSTAREVQCLRFEKIAPGRPYHAALSITEGASARGYRIQEHSHDFYEMVFALAGNAIHGINGIETSLGTGNLVLLRPGDRHFIRFETGRLLHYINIAMEATLWCDFHVLIGNGADLDGPVIRNTTLPIGENTPDACAAAFRRALVRFQDTQIPSAALRAEACLLLATVAPWLLSDAGQNGVIDADLPAEAPLWLINACRLLQRDTNALRSGLPAFVAEAGVTRTHLARVLKVAINQTPTEYINRLRLERAARLLTTTTLSILDVAEECGFEQPAYFYRLFRDRFATSPYAYRISATRHVAPKSPTRQA